MPNVPQLSDGTSIFATIFPLCCVVVGLTVVVVGFGVVVGLTVVVVGFGVVVVVGFTVVVGLTVVVSPCFQTVRSLIEIVFPFAIAAKSKTI